MPLSYVIHEKMVATPTTELPLQVRRLDRIQSYVIPDKNNTFGENCKHSSHLFRFILDFFFFHSFLNK